LSCLLAESEDLPVFLDRLRDFRCDELSLEVQRLEINLPASEELINAPNAWPRGGVRNAGGDSAAAGHPTVRERLPRGEPLAWHYDKQALD
jgi:hypothetical protein